MTVKKGQSLQEFLHSRGVVKELHPDVARVAIEGYTDDLSSAQRTDDAFYRQFTCPSCGNATMTKEFAGGSQAVGVTWVEGEVTPQALLRCTECRCLINPRSGMIVERGSHAPIFDEGDLGPGLYR